VTAPRLLVDEEAPLSPAEREVLAHPPAQWLGSLPDEPAYRLSVAREPPWALPDGPPAADRVPARLQAIDGRVRVLHRRFQAEIDPHARVISFYRREPAAGGLAVAMRTALACQLPLSASLPLHAAGVLLKGQGLVFFGPSGAGKSTLAATFDGPVLSDELVAVGGEPFRLWSTGVAGTLGERGSTAGSGPLWALVELAKADRFELQTLPAAVARQRLLQVIQVPLDARLWSAALAVLGRLLRSVPVYRMAWSRSEAPWDALRSLVPAQDPRVSR
jgi:hypothetical protein